MGKGKNRRKQAQASASAPLPRQASANYQADVERLEEEFNSNILFFFVPLLIALLFALSTFVRNEAWKDAGTLWCDVVNKLYEERIFDPSQPGEVESPRSERGRAYNNIGLYLYDMGRFLLSARYSISKNATGEALEKSREEINKFTNDIIENIPDEFRAEYLRQLKISLNLPAPTESQIGIIMDGRAFSKEAYSLMHNPQYLMAWDTFIGADLCLTKALRHRPTYWIARLNIGLVKKLRGNLRDAEEEFRMAHTFSDSYEKALRYHAGVLFELRDYQECIDIAQRAWKLVNDTQSAELIANSSLSLGRFADAEEWCNKLLRHEPRNPEYLFTAARAYAMQGKTEQSRAAFAKVCALVPNIPDCYLDFATSLIQAKNYVEAEKVLAEAQAKFPANSEILSSLSSLWIERIPEAGALQKAQDYAQLAIKTAPNDPNALLALGRCQELANDLKGAEQSYTAAHNLAPGSHGLAFVISLMLERQDRSAEAMQWLAKALKAAPANPDYLAAQKRLNAKLGQR